MHSRIGGHKGQSIGELKTLLSQRAMLAQTADAERRLVHQMQGHARPERLTLALAPGAEQSQVPRRRCSGAKSQIPTWFPEILSASNWRTSRWRLAGSQGSRRFLRWVRCVWICWGIVLGRQA